MVRSGIIGFHKIKTIKSVFGSRQSVFPPQLNLHHKRCSTRQRAALFLSQLRYKLELLTKLRPTGPQQMGTPAQAQRSGLRGEKSSKGVIAVFDVRQKRTKRTLRRRGFGEAPQQAFLPPFWRKNFECVHTRIACQKQVWLHLHCLPLVHPSERPGNGGNAFSFVPIILQFLLIVW